mgnify:CR=1 FL=1
MTTITLSAASAKTSAFRSAYPNAKKGILFSATDFAAIAGQEGCVVVKAYFCLDSSNSNDLNLVLVGVDADGNDMTSGALRNSGQACPPNCGESNALNS